MNTVSLVSKHGMTYNFNLICYHSCPRPCDSDSATFASHRIVEFEMQRITLLLLLLISVSVSAQENQENTSQPGTFNGIVDLTGQYYLEDEEIGALVPPQTYGMNAYALLGYTKGDFTAGMRLESYLPALNGYPVLFDGSGIGYRYVSWQKEGLEVTVGNFYEQFGNGMIFRTFEERAIGIDNAMDGLRARYTITPGLNVKGMIGKQRLQFDDGLINGEGIIRGLDADLNFNQLFSSMKDSPLSLSLGGSFVSKYNDQNNTNLYNLPANVAAGAVRADLQYKDWRLGAEYMGKANDPYPSVTVPEFDYVYKNGQGLFTNLGYSVKGFAVDLTARHLDNVTWRSTNAGVSGNELSIGYLPALSKQHTYNLVSSLYPYATNLFGEVSFRGDISYKFKKKTALGGKYGTTVSFSATQVNTPERTMLNDESTDRQIYSTSLFQFNADSTLLRDINVEVKKKLSKKVKMQASYYNFYFDDRVQLVASKELIKADIAVLDVTWKVKKKKTLRFEAQHLWTDEHDKNWVFGQIEYSMSPHWIITVLDQYNYENPKSKIHYPLANIVYSTGPHRFSFQYGKQRAGWFCVGGICREVPASNGLTFTLTSSF